MITERILRMVCKFIEKENYGDVECVQLAVDASGI